MNEVIIVKNLIKFIDVNYWYVYGMLFIFESNFICYSY